MNERMRDLCTTAAVAGLMGVGGAAAQEVDQGYKLPRPEVAAAFPYEARFVEVNGQRIAYVEDGTGDPIVFIHGNPTSSYLWRNIIPQVTDRGRAIALDLVGMGRSSKPRPALRFVDQIAAFEGFARALDLRSLTLVVHDWGAAIGFEYARLHPENVRAVAFMEGVLPPIFPQTSFEAMGEDMGGCSAPSRTRFGGGSWSWTRTCSSNRCCPGS